MMPPGTNPSPMPCVRKAGLNGLELFSPYSDPPGCVGAYRLAVDNARPLLLKSFAVLALAIAIARLPGHGSLPLLIMEHSTPCRSTTADHIRFGLKMPPLASPKLITVASLDWIALTVDAGIPQPPKSPNPNCACKSPGADAAKANASILNFFKESPPSESFLKERPSRIHCPVVYNPDIMN